MFFFSGLWLKPTIFNVSPYQETVTHFCGTHLLEQVSGVEPSILQALTALDSVTHDLCPGLTSCSFEFPANTLHGEFIHKSVKLPSSFLLSVQLPQ